MATSDSPSKALAVQDEGPKSVLKGAPPAEARFLRAVAEGVSLAGAAELAGMTEAEARAVLQTEEAQDRLERLKDWVHMRTRQAEQDDAAVRGMAGRAYIILRLRAVIEDPAAPPAAKVNALDKLGKFYGMWDARAEPVRDLEGVTTEKLVELGRGVAAQAAKPKKPDEH